MINLNFNRRLALFAGLALVTVDSAQAQHSHSHAAANGGQIQKIGNYEAEFAVKGSQATLYLTDEADKKVDSAKFSGTASVLAKGNVQKTVELKPSGDNRLSGPVDFPVEGKLRATVTLRNASGDVGKARYSVDQK